LEFINLQSEGEDDGFALGTDEGKKLGVKDGSSEGKADGFELGKAEGKSESTSSFSISSENDETVNANSGHVSWYYIIKERFSNLVDFFLKIFGCTSYSIKF
jgi:hypothetical protein